MQGVGFLLVIYLLCEFFLFLNKGTFITGLKRMIYKGLRDIGDIKSLVQTVSALCAGF